MILILVREVEPIRVYEAYEILGKAAQPTVGHHEFTSFLDGLPVRFPRTFAMPHLLHLEPPLGFPGPL